MFSRSSKLDRAVCGIAATALPPSSWRVSVLQEITSRGATYKSLAEPWADTTTELGEVLAALVGYIARKTREDIIRRTTAGRERARARGVKFGRPAKLSPLQKQEALARCRAGESQAAIASSYCVHAATISRMATQAGVIAPQP